MCSIALLYTMHRTIHTFYLLFSTITPPVFSVGEIHILFIVSMGQVPVNYMTIVQNWVKYIRL